VVVAPAPMKTIGRTLQWVLPTLVLMILSSLLGDALLFKAPSLAARAFAPSGKALCQQLRSGTSQEEVLRRIDGWFPPSYERLDESRLEFLHSNEGTCVVEIDHLTRRVSATHFEPPQPASWDTRGDWYPED
jgi:hypothetical protein